VDYLLFLHFIVQDVPCLADQEISYWHETRTFINFITKPAFEPDA